MNDLRIVAHRPDARYPLFWFDVQGPLDSCGHRHSSRIEAGQCKRQLENAFRKEER